MVEFETDKAVGQHKGFWFHTIGQRQGSGLAGGPWYVVQKILQVILCICHAIIIHAEKQRDTFAISACNWITGYAPTQKELQVKMRHGKQLYDCTLEPLANNHYQISLNGKDQGIAPGQFAVLYDGQECLGAGIID